MKRILIIVTAMILMTSAVGNTRPGQKQKAKKLVNKKNETRTGQKKNYVKREITLEKALKMAMKRDIDYKNASLDVEISLMKILQAEAGRWPSLNFTVTGTGMYNSAGLSGVDTWLNDDYFTIIGSGELSLTLPLYTGGKLTHSIYMAKDELRIKKLTLEKVKKALKLKVKNTFYGYMIAKEQYRVARDSYRLNLSNYAISRRNFLRGLKPEIEVLQIQVSLEQARSSMLTAETNLKKVKNDLEDLIGPVVNEKGTVIKGSLETEFLKIPKETAIDLAYKSNDDIAITEMGYSIAKHNRVIAASNRLPSINFFANSSVTHISDTQITYYNIMGTNVPGGTSRAGSKINWQISFGIQILFPISEMLYPKSINATKAQISQYDYEIKKTANLVKQIKDQIRLQIVNHYNNLKVLKKQIEMYKRLIKVARRNLALANIRYRSGNMDYLTMRNIENQYLNVALQLNTYLYNYILIKTQVLHLIGKTD